MKCLSRIFLLLPFAPVNWAGPLKQDDSVVPLDYGTFKGTLDGDLLKFLGVPFAAPPVGNLRFAPPQAPLRFSDVKNATQFGAACFPQAISSDKLLEAGIDLSPLLSGFPPPPATVSEDCLFVNVLRPKTIPAGKKLPVVFWIYGGDFEVGDTSSPSGETVVARSLAIEEPVIYVSANYRVNAFGFLGGKEIKAARLGNVGLRDQRFAFQWVQNHISAFGGDPNKVTLWGESAGAWSIGLHLVINDGNIGGLFRGAFMESGSPSYLPDITTQQPLFDQIVAETGCSGSADPITCLRNVPLDILISAINTTPNVFSGPSLHFSFGPSVDGQVITRNPLTSLQKGLYAKIPFVTGDCDDEGTLFSLVQNLTTSTQFLDFIQKNYFLGTLTPSQLAAVGNAYPENPTEGSPFDTSTTNALTSQYKRLSSFQGDIVFQAPRRNLLQIASKTQATYAFLYKRGKNTPFLGSFHSSDIPEFYGTGTSPDFIGTDALINFVNNLNPNRENNSTGPLSKINWNTWGSSVTNPPLLTFLDGPNNSTTLQITSDTFRVGPMNLLNTLQLRLP